MSDTAKQFVFQMINAPVLPQYASHDGCTLAKLRFTLHWLFQGISGLLYAITIHFMLIIVTGCLPVHDLACIGTTMSNRNAFLHITVPNHATNYTYVECICTYHAKYIQWVIGEMLIGNVTDVDNLYLLCCCSAAVCAERGRRSFWCSYAKVSIIERTNGSCKYLTFMYSEKSIFVLQNECTNRTCLDWNKIEILCVKLPVTSIGGPWRVFHTVHVMKSWLHEIAHLVRVRSDIAVLPFFFFQH